MNWDDVRVLLVLLRAKTLHRAGVTLGVDASTVSRRLSALEARLGAPLFTRTRDGLAPTAAAERLRAHAERMDAEATALVQTARIGDTRIDGTVRVATTDALAQLLTGEGLLSICRNHPGLVIELLGGNVPLDLTRGEADIALRLAALRQKSLRAVCVASMNVGLYAAPAYLHSRSSLGTSTVLCGHDVLLPTGDLSRLPEAQRLREEPGVRVILMSNSMPALVAAAVAGHGIVPLPVGWGDREPGLERIRVLEGVPKRKIWLVTHERTSARRAVRVVANAIAEICQRLFAK